MGDKEVELQRPARPVLATLAVTGSSVFLVMGPQGDP